ncbi:MAG TPA: type II CAAX endopeptidase family protein [Bryobacteraceae bacterium]|nr:type II CAAX endopeptidase family protein [Bryobacteraceae bacterium]
MSPVAAIAPASPTWNRREIALYFALAYGISLVLWLPVIAGTGLSRFLFSVGTFGPAIAALLAHRIVTGNWKAIRLRTTLTDTARGVIPGAGAVLMAAFSAAFFMTKSGLDRWQWPALWQILTLFGPNLMGGPLGEEPGWRGYALPRLQGRFHPLTSSLALGFLWANWHLPLFLAHVYNVAWWQFVIMTMAASVFLSFAFNRSEGSVLSAVLVHGLYNVGTGIILNDLIGKATLYDNTVQHNILWIAYAGVAVLLCIVTKGRLGYRPDAAG